MPNTAGTATALAKNRRMSVWYKYLHNSKNTTIVLVCGGYSNSNIESLTTTQEKNYYLATPVALQPCCPSPSQQAAQLEVGNMRSMLIATSLDTLLPKVST